ncbi:MAG: DUF58 domain-containing protein [Planctomycetaceae bacterium]
MSRPELAIQVRLTRLGWHFAFVGMFAMVGGAIRGFNLPLVLAGLIVGALLMQWRLGRRTIEGLDCRRRMPDEAFVGQPFCVRFLVCNRGRWLPAWLIRIDDQVDSSDAGITRRAASFLSLPIWREPGSFVASCGVGTVAPGRTVVTSYECVAAKRGKYFFGPASVSTGAPLGLMLVKLSRPEKQSIFIFPELLTLRRDWRRRLQSRSGGVATTARRSGASDGDFFGLRSWQAGDSRRWIHWRTTARIGEPAVRQFEQQRRFDLCILVDAFAPFDELDSDPSTHRLASESLELTVSTAASLLTHIAPTPTNRIALAVAGAEVSVVTGGGSRGQLTAMLQRLAEVVPARDPALIDAVDKVFRSVGKPQDLVVISPRAIPASAENMGRLLSGRCSLRWFCVADGTIDLLVERTRPKRVGQSERGSTPDQTVRMGDQG